MSNMQMKRAALAAAAMAVATSVSGLPLREEADDAVTVTTFDFDAVLQDADSSAWFSRNLFCSKESFLVVCNILRGRVQSAGDVASSALVGVSHSFEKKVALVLYFLCCRGGYREAAAVFGMSKSWAVLVVAYFVGMLSNMVPETVYLPRTSDEEREIERGFYQMRHFPGVLGAVDGTIIEIQRPAIFDGFYCRYFYPALNMQAIVDHKMRFRSIDIRPGSWSDRKIWSASVVGQTASRRLPPGCHYLGDAGYTLAPWLLTPYLPAEENGGLNRSQRRFNFYHSSTRMTVERTFGLWKGRFRILQRVMDEKSLEKTVAVIAATVVLHNILVDLRDSTEIDLYTPEPIAQPQQDSGELPLVDRDRRYLARTKRDDYAKLFVN